MTQIDTDGRTVWVHRESDGYCIGRFSAKGIDVHAGPFEADHCLHCEPGVAPFHPLPDRSQWLLFIEKMMEHHGVDVPEDTLTEFREIS